MIAPRALLFLFGGFLVGMTTVAIKNQAPSPPPSPQPETTMATPTIETSPESEPTKIQINSHSSATSDGQTSTLSFRVEAAGNTLKSTNRMTVTKGTRVTITFVNHDATPRTLVFSNGTTSAPSSNGTTVVLAPFILTESLTFYATGPGSITGSITAR